MEATHYICTICRDELSEEGGAGLRCKEGLFFSFLETNSIAVFDSECGGTNEYTVEESAEIHDNALN